MPDGGANFRVYKTTANGNDYFGNLTELTIGHNTFTVSAVNFDRAVKFQFSSGAVGFSALSLNGVDTECVVSPAPTTSSIASCGDFDTGTASAWPFVIVAANNFDGVSSQATQTFTMNITSIPDGGGSFRVYKTTANGSDYFGNLTELVLGLNTFTVAAVDFDRTVKFQFSSGEVVFDALNVNGENSNCVLAPSLPTNSLISDCEEFDSGNASAWPFVLEATNISDGSSSQAAQTFTMNVTSLPESGANFRIFKTNANGSNYFGNLTELTLGFNTFTVAAVDFDRTVKFQFSSGEVEFDALSLNGENSGCITPPTLPTSSLISDCSDFILGPNISWPFVLNSALISDGESSQLAQSFTMNVTSLPENGANFRVTKTTANGNWTNGDPIEMVLGENTINVAAVDFNRTVKFQFTNGDVVFDALNLNGIDSDCAFNEQSESVLGCIDISACNYNELATNDDGSCEFPESINYSFLYNKQGWSGAGGCIVTHDDEENAILMDVNGNNPVMRSPQNLSMNALEFGSVTITLKNMSSTSTGFKLQYLQGTNTLLGDIQLFVDVNMTDYQTYTISLSQLDTLGIIDRLGFKGPFQSSGDSVYIKSIVLNKYIDCGVCNVDFDNDGVCDNYEILGCTDSVASNFNPSATEDDETCEYVIDGCTDILACNYNELATDDDGTCEFPESINYSFLYNKQGWSGAGGCTVTHDDEENAILMNVNGDNPVMRSPNNIDLNAAEFGSATITLKNMSSTTSGFKLQYLQGTSNLIGDVQFFVDANMTDYQTYTISLSALDSLGIIDRLGFKGPYESTGDSVYIRSLTLNKYIDCGICNVDLNNNGTCDNNEIFGCTDLTAINYSDIATVEDGSCEYIPVDIQGCTDMFADNFNPNATVDDGSCTFCNSFSIVILGIYDVSINGGSDGSVQATGTGGSNNYSISVQDASGVEQNPFALAAGDYTVVVTDFISGCVDSESFTIAEPVVAEEPCDIVPSGLFVNNIIHNRITFNWSAPSAAPHHIT